MKLFKKRDYSADEYTNEANYCETIIFTGSHHGKGYSVNSKFFNRSGMNHHSCDLSHGTHI